MRNVFVDTNILLYRFDARQPEKQSVAVRVVHELGDALVVSTQVLQEFYSVGTRKLRLSPSGALEVIDQLCKRRVIQVSSAMIVAAIDTSERYRINFWDSLIVEAAASGGCSALYTEDLNGGHKIRGVTIVNPFSA